MTEVEKLKKEVIDLKAELEYLHSLVGQTITFEGGLYYLINAWDYDDLSPR